MSFKISIITPLHEIMPSYFKACAASMKSQTFGLENIEWIVVIHNSSDENAAEVSSMLEGLPSVRVIRLNNDKHTPSSPRNAGLDAATGDYVGFLDGDDSFLPECVERVLGYITKHKAQAAVFRREYELEDKDGIPVTEIVLWNQLYEEILVEKGRNWDGEKIFSGLFGMVTSKFYDRRFLEENGIRFDESVPFGEDYLFNLNVYARLDSVVYLPQFIRYHYLINKGSLVQSSVKDGPALTAYAKGYAKIFEAGLNAGFYMNAIISRLCVVLARFMSGNNRLTLADRIEIKRILEPYIMLTRMMTPNKVYSAKTVKESYIIPRDVILNPERWAEEGTALLAEVSYHAPHSTYDMSRILSRILEANQSTDIGQFYCFSDIMTLKGFRSRIPLTEYSNYEPLFKLTSRIGEKNIFTSEELASYVLYLDDAEDLSVFPVTRTQVQRYARMYMRAWEGHNVIFLGESFPKVFMGNDGIPANTLHGTVISALYAMPDALPRIRMTSPKEILFPKEICSSMYAKALFALRDKDADIISAPSCCDIADFFEVIEHEHEQLCYDIEHAVVSAGEGTMVSDTSFAPAPERADELRRIFAEGFKGFARKVWPKLERVNTKFTDVHDVYTEMLRYYVGSDVVCENKYFEVSGLILGEWQQDRNAFLLSGSEAFCEFLPEGSGETLLSDELSEGMSCELVITTGSGLCRFRTGRVIRIVSADSGKVYFTVPLNAEDMKFSSAAQRISNALGVRIPDFAYYHDNHRTVLIIEPYDVNDAETVMKADTENLKRIAGLEGAVDIMYGAPQTHSLYRDVTRYKNQLAMGCAQPVHKLCTEPQRKFFASQLIATEVM